MRISDWSSDVCSADLTVPSSGVFAKCDPVQSSRTPTRSGRSSASAGQLFLTVQQDASRHWASCNLRFPTLPSEAGGMRHAHRWCGVLCRDDKHRETAGYGWAFGSCPASLANAATFNHKNHVQLNSESLRVRKKWGSKCKFP